MFLEKINFQVTTEDKKMQYDGISGLAIHEGFVGIA